ncbi:hypothetical protein LB572_03195 [Mesorhizobium sp. BH1-1-5]|uniref:hypothetical protein n=1 Tax=Mesorhizobium sp. BH1-1-5 TaxID=2876661 RepID=UPI001CCB51B6|nr:hypothetical protein [Mesorhizobium sp. BH1-1-5]MBZ9986099.1 hypothetical protein [Mesorhizobium sp. BH1-1-5]
MDNDGRINAIDLYNNEVEGILDVLVFIGIEADPDQHQALNGACVTLLYLARERLKKAGAKLHELRAAA